MPGEVLGSVVNFKKRFNKECWIPLTMETDSPINCWVQPHVYFERLFNRALRKGAKPPAFVDLLSYQNKTWKDWFDYLV